MAAETNSATPPTTASRVPLFTLELLPGSNGDVPHIDEMNGRVV
jgi:hypothetical protein